MRLCFIYSDINNLNFKKNLVRYNILLKNYFDKNDPTIIKKLNTTFEDLLKSCMKYEMLTPKESEVYNIIIEFLSTNLDQKELDSVKTQDVSQDIKVTIIEKISAKMPDIDVSIIKSIIEKSQNIMQSSDTKNIEVVFIPSAVNVK